MSINSVSTRAMLLAGAATCLTAGAAGAQQSGSTEAARRDKVAAAQAASQANTGRPTEQEPIIVTALKKSQRLQDVPASVTAIGQDDIQSLRAKTIDDLARTVPGLFIPPDQPAEFPVIRGIQSGGTTATVGLYIDDTPVQTRTNLGDYEGNLSLNLYDLDRVEVLRGPQGTLYGGSAMGGVIRYVTPQPSLGLVTGRVSSELSTIQGGGVGFEQGVALGGGIIPGTLGFRGSLYFSKSAGYIDRVSQVDGSVLDPDANTNRTIQGHLALLLKPTERLSITPSVLFQNVHTDNLNWYLSNLPRYQSDMQPTPGHDRLFLPSLDVKYDFGAATLSSMTSYLKRDVNQVFDYAPWFAEIFAGVYQPNYISLAYRLYKQRSFTEEARIQSNGDGRLNYSLGVFYNRQTTNLFFNLYEPATAITFAPQLPGHISYWSHYGDTDRQIAGYGEVSFKFTNRLSATAGVRYSRLDHSGIVETNGPLAGGVLVSTPAHDHATSVDPKFVATYKFSRDHMFYASATRGFRPGGDNPPFPADAAFGAACAAQIAQASANGFPVSNSYKPDHIWSYEVGSKNSFLDHRLTLNASVYQINWSRIQQTIYIPACSYGFTTNFGTARSRGVEAELAATLASGLTMKGEVSYNKSVFTSSVLGLPDPTTGISAIYALKGDSSSQSPNWTGSVSADYHSRLAPNASGYLHADVQYVGKFLYQAPEGEVNYDPALIFFYNGNYIKSYEYVSVRAGVIWNNWNYSVFVKNLTNAHPLLNVNNYYFYPLDNRARESTLTPRTFGVSAQHNF